jgi:hypothetical protein
LGETGSAGNDDDIALIFIAELPKQVIKLAIHLGNPGSNNADARAVVCDLSRG